MEEPLHKDILSDLIGNIVNKLSINYKKHSFFFIYEKGTHQSLYHLLTDNSQIESDTVSHVRVSFSGVRFFSDKIHKNYLPKTPILTSNEIASIISATIIDSQLSYLLNSVDHVSNVPSFQFKLSSIINLFNEINHDLVINISIPDLTKMLRIVLLTLPQLETKEALFNKDLDIHQSSGMEKLIKTNVLIKQHNKKSLPFQDRLFLLITICEGFFWKIEEPKPIDIDIYMSQKKKNVNIEDVIAKIKKKGMLEDDDLTVLYNDYKCCKIDLQNFLTGNLFKLLVSKTISSSNIKSIIKGNAYLLLNINYYLYGTFRNIEDVKKDLRNIFINNIFNIILFSRQFLLNNNYFSSRRFVEITSPYYPISTVYGLINTLQPNSVLVYGIKEIGERNYIKLGVQFDKSKNTVSKKPIDEFCSIWGKYESPSSYQEDLSSSKQIHGISIECDNISGEKRIIALHLSRAKLLDLKLITGEDKYINHDFYFYIDHLNQIDKAAIYNTNYNDWYYKAFCNLYIEADKERHSEADKERHSNNNNNVIHYLYRSWEDKYLEEYFSTLYKDKVIIYDLAGGYGRLFYKLEKYIKKIDKYYLVDSSNLMVKAFNNVIYDQQSTKYYERLAYNNKLNSIICDLRNIDLITKDNAYEKADIIFLAYTSFGYFSSHLENESVLAKAFSLLELGGKLIIEQFNPYLIPAHVKQGIKSYNKDEESSNAVRDMSTEIFPFYYALNSKNRKCRLIKTSHFIKAGKCRDDCMELKPCTNDFIERVGVNCKFYAQYYGNYTYYDLEGHSEELIKHDTYRISLYTEEWFKQVLPNEGIQFSYFKNGIECAKFDDIYVKKTNNGEGNQETIDDPSIMIVEITKKSNDSSSNMLLEETKNQIFSRIKRLLPKGEEKRNSIVIKKIESITSIDIIDSIIKIKDNKLYIGERLVNDEVGESFLELLEERLKPSS